MSAFIVNDETINQILAGLEYGDYGHYGGVALDYEEKPWK